MSDENKVEAPVEEVVQTPQAEVTTPVVEEVKAEAVVEQPKVEAPAPKVEDRGTQKGNQGNKNRGPQPVPQAKPVVKEVVKEEVSDFQSLVQKLKVGGTPAEVQLVTALDNYVDAMKPGRPIDGTPGVNQQYKLWTTLHRVIEESSTQEFSKLWNVVVAYFREYQNGVFNGQYVNRFSEFWTRTDDELYAFQQLTNLLILAATDRQNLTKLLSINKVVEKKFTEVGRGRLIQMYS